MRRTGRIKEFSRRARLSSGCIIAAFAMGLLLLVTPVATAASGEGLAGAPGGVVLAQTAPPSGEQPVPPAGTPQPAPRIDQHALVGAAGIALIALVLLSRRARKKPIFGVWRPKK